MASIISRLFLRKQLTKPPIAQKMLVVEKSNTLASNSLSLGGSIIKTGAVVTTLGAIGMKTQEFKNDLFGNLLNGSDTLGNLGNSIGQKLESATSDFITGGIIIGGFVILGLVLKQSLK